jgi:hypothetical protein
MNFWKRLTSSFTKSAPSESAFADSPRRSPALRDEDGAAQPSSFEDLNYNRNGKIAHLPRALRDRINLALYNRTPAKDLARALNQMPEVQAIMAQYFNGRPIKRQNVQEWKHGGYRDWLHHRQLLEQKRELAADAKDLSDTAKGTAESLFGLLTLNYADLMMNGDKETPEEFEQRRKKFSLVSQDIARMHRCHINARRVEVQEARLERDEEKTEEQLHFKFMEWTDNPAIRRACILEPMEKDRQMRKLYNMPPRPEDSLVERLTKDDPYFNPPARKQTKSKPKPAEKSGTGVPPVSGSKPEPSLRSASEKGPASPIRPISPLSPIPANSNLNPQNSTLPKPPLSDYERALREGKTFLEALYLQSARPKPGSQPPAQPAGSSAWDSFSQKVDVYSGFRLGPAISLRSALSRNTPG